MSSCAPTGHGPGLIAGSPHSRISPEVGALVIIGYPKFEGGLGGYARYISVRPSDWPHGRS